MRPHFGLLDSVLVAASIPLWVYGWVRRPANLADNLPAVVYMVVIVGAGVALSSLRRQPHGIAISIMALALLFVVLNSVMPVVFP